MPRTMAVSSAGNPNVANFGQVPRSKGARHLEQNYVRKPISVENSIKPLYHIAVTITKLLPNSYAGVARSRLLEALRRSEGHV